MGLQIPPPDETTLGDMKYTWKATAEQRETDGEVVTVYDYVITHEDGTRTLRTVTDVNGEKSTTERRETGVVEEKKDDRKPIEPPVGMPPDATFDAKRVVFTDEDGSETTTIDYTVYTRDGKYWQKQVQGDGDPEITRGTLEPLTDADVKVVMPDQPHKKHPEKKAPVSRASSYLQEPDQFLPPRRAASELSDDRRGAVRARGSVADRYLKNLK